MAVKEMGMVERFWGCVARWLSRHPRVVDWLIERAKRTPYFHLEGYMLRWWLVEKPLTRWLDRRARIHEILREDLGDCPHNHPWSFRTLILRGWYVEQRGDQRIIRRAGDTARLEHEEFHQITAVCEGTVTLCIIGPKVASWGFLSAAGDFIPWRDYLRMTPHLPWEQGAES